MKKVLLSVAALSAYFESPITGAHDTTALQGIFEESEAEGSEDVSEKKIAVLKSGLIHLRHINEYGEMELGSMKLLENVKSVDALETFLSIAMCEYNGRSLSLNTFHEAESRVNEIFETFKTTGEEFKEKMTKSFEGLTEIWFRKKKK